MKKDKVIIYLVLGIMPYEGETVLHAYANRQDAERKLDALEIDEAKTGYSRYEIQPIELN